MSECFSYVHSFLLLFDTENRKCMYGERISNDLIARFGRKSQIVYILKSRVKSCHKLLIGRRRKKKIEKTFSSSSFSFLTILRKCCSPRAELLRTSQMATHTQKKKKNNVKREEKFEKYYLLNY